MDDRLKEYQERQNRFKVWLCRLQSLLEKGAVCQHHSNLDSSIARELKEFKTPLNMRQPDIDIFPTLEKLTSLENLTEDKELIEDILNVIKSEQKLICDERIYNLRLPPSIYKKIVDKKLQSKLSTVLKSQEYYNSDSNIVTEGSVSKELSSYRNTSKEKNKKNNVSKEIVLPDSVMQIHEKQKKPPNKAAAANKLKVLTEKKERITYNREKCLIEKKVNSPSDKEVKSNIEKSSPETQKIKPNKIKQNTADPSCIVSMIKKAQQKKPEKVKQPIMTAAIIVPKIADLPMPVRLEVTESKESGSVVECSALEDTNKEMIKGENIVDCYHNYKDEHIAPVKSIFHKVCDSVTNLTYLYNAPTTNISPRDSGIQKKSKSTSYKENMEEHGKGIIKYQLSNPEFIQKGWTQLPTIKIMRRMNIYKMIPAHPQLNWFMRNINKKIVYYATGEKLAEIDDNGCGRWYYKNGKMALDYYCAQEANIGYRYIIYSDGVDDIGKPTSTTVLGAFDTLGNGVVYDVFGNERLKYNQSEGMLKDEKLGPPSRWKWHSLNDPPDLKQVFVDTHTKYPTCIEVLQEQNKPDSGIKETKETQVEMLNIELENFLKEKEHKLLQKFKPFQIKTKTVKLNRQFSIRIFDQANIYIGFNEGRTSLKLNIGTLLINNEILDTETEDQSTLMTPYDRPIPKSESVSEIQHLIRDAGIVKSKTSVFTTRTRRAD